MQTNDFEKKFKRKLIELLTLSDVLKDLNLSLDLDTEKIIEVFSYAVTGLFLTEKLALIIFDGDKPVYVAGEDEGFKEKIEKIKFKLEKIYPAVKEKKDGFFVGEIEDVEIKKELTALNIELVVPMFLRKELRGVYLIGRKLNQEMYSAEDKSLLFAFANQAGVAIENANFFKKLQRHVEELTVFNEITAAINSGLEAEILLDMVLGILIKMLGAFSGFIIILRENKSVLFFVSRELDEKRKEIILKGKDTDGMVNRALHSISDKLAFFYPKDSLPQERDLFLDEVGNKYYWFYRVVFIQKENIVGAVGLTKKIGETLTEENVNLFLSLTGQLIMIVLNARLYELAITDGLTGFFVHRYFDQRLKEEISRARRYSSFVSVVIIDIDRFKECNDRLGHLMGNFILKKIASVISSSIRKNEDIPCRWGGDEFTIILPETNREGAFVLAERIRKNIETIIFSYEGKTTKVTVSAGISSFPTDALEDKDLINQADSALYQAKQTGRNKVVLYGEDTNK